jgi:hypothetical protein
MEDGIGFDLGDIKSKVERLTDSITVVYSISTLGETKWEWVVLLLVVS